MAEKNQIDLQKVKELIDLMVANNLVEVEISDNENKILLKRPQPDKRIITHLPATHVPPAPMPAVEPTTTQDKTEGPAKQQQEDENLVEITSPIVGTFYASPSPDSEHFVSVGSQVNPDTVVCIVEAMKVMNEIKAETSGTIVKILCKAGQAVEYGQVLFKVKPD